MSSAKNIEIGRPSYSGFDRIESRHSGNFSGGVRKGDQPSPNFATRLSTASASPPSQIGSLGDCSGFGAKPMSLKLTNSPSNSGLSCVHSAMMAARYSSAIFPRFSKETFFISNSSYNQPQQTKDPAR